MVTIANEEDWKMEAKEQEAIAKGMRMLWIVWGAMLASLVLYIGVCHFLAEQISPRFLPSVPAEMMSNILYGIAAISLFAAHFLRKLLVKNKIKLPKATGPKMTSAQNQPPFVMHYFTAVVISLAISESIGLYGFVLFFLWVDFQSLYSFMAIAAAAMIYFRPKREELQGLAALEGTETMNPGE